MLQIEMPDVIFSDALEQIGAPVSIDAAETYTGVGVSAGVAIGKARVLLAPSNVNPSDRDYNFGMSIDRPCVDTAFSACGGFGNGAGWNSVTRRGCRERVWRSCGCQHSECNSAHH